MHVGAVKPRDARNKGRQPKKFSCLSRLAPSVMCMVICVFRILLDGLQKKDRLLIV